MPHPSSLSTVTVSDTILDLGVPAAGSIRFVSSVWLNSTVDASSLAAVDVTVTLDGTGSFSIVLPANDDADWSPKDWAYLVVVTVNGKRVQGSLTLPASPATVNLFDALVLDAPPTGGGGSSGPVAWSAITGKPLTFPPSAHTHVLSDVTGLVSGLAGKANAVHTHVEGDVTSLVADLGALSGRITTLENAGGGGGGTAATFARDIVTTGDVAAPSDATWVPLTGLSLSLPAAVGDDVELYVGCLLDANNAGSDAYEMCVVAGGAVARFASTGTGTANTSGEGDPAKYPATGGQRFQHYSATMSFTVASGDLTGGNVVFGIAHKGPGGGKVFASAPYPFRWRARNDH